MANKVVQTVIDQFDGGMTANARPAYRSTSGGVLFARPQALIVRHFDPVSSADRLDPFVDHVTDALNGVFANFDEVKLNNFLTYGTNQSNTAQYALGVNTGTSNARIYKRDSIPTGQWSGLSATTVAHNENMFVEYKGDFYCAVGGTAIAKYNVAGNSWTNSDRAITYTNVAQGLAFSKDDRLYVAYDNKVDRKNDATTWAGTVLTLPSNCIITCICEYGNYLAVATKPTTIAGRSRVFLWDTSATSWNEMIDWGSENLQIIEEIGGYLVGVSDTGLSSVNMTPHILFKYYDGRGAVQFNALDCSSTTVLFGKIKQKQNDRIYFSLSVEIDNVWYAGIFAVAKLANGFSVYIDRMWDDATTFDASDSPLGFQLLGDYFTIAYKDNGTYNVKRSNAQDFGANSTYETLVFNAGDSSIKKDLLGISLTTEPIPSGSSVTVSYKADNDTSWTSIFTYSTVNGVAYSTPINEDQAVQLPKGYREIQFQIKSVGSGVQTSSAVVTSLTFKEEIIGHEVY